MSVLLGLLILSAPVALAALLSWVSHPNGHSRPVSQFGDPDWDRIQHDIDAARTRFEPTPS